MAVYKSNGYGAPKKNALNSGAFKYGSIPALESQLKSASSASGADTNLRSKVPSPASVPLTALNGLQGSIDAAKQLRANPLGDPAAAQSLNQIQSVLNRQQQSAVGAAKGRATASGQGFSAGAMRDTALGLQQANAASYADASAQLALKLAEQGRMQEAELMKAQLQGELEANKNALAKYGIDADLATNEAKLRLTREEMQRNNLIEQARLAENSRQFGLELGEKGRMFDTELGQKAKMFDETNALDKSQFDRKMKLADDEFGLKRREMDLREKEDAFQKAKESLGLAERANDKGFLTDRGLSGAYSGVLSEGASPVSAWERLNGGSRKGGKVSVGGALIDPNEWLSHNKNSMGRYGTLRKR